MPNYSGMWTVSQALDAIAAGNWVLPPGAPTSVTATAGNASASVAFTAPTNTGTPAGIASYTVTSNPGGFTGTGASSPITVSGLTNGTAYTFTVTATATNGLTGPASSASNSVTPVPTYLLFSVGYGGNGRLGLNNTTDYSSPKQVGSSRWKYVGATDASSLAVKEDNTLWSWGNNAVGQLGLGNTTYYSSPKQVGSLANWLNVNGGSVFTLAVKTDGTLWAWGNNQGYGALGIGVWSGSYSSPVQVGALTNWLVTASGYQSSIALKTDGTLWAWGRNEYGQLGIGNQTDKNSPNQVGSGTNWYSIASGFKFAAATKTDGTLWTWGFNQFGALGHNNTTYYSSPKQVGALTNWAMVATGKGSYAMLAIKTDGTLWSWGYNAQGQLGLGNTTNYSSPKQVGALTNWSKIYQANHSTISIKTDGTLWSWGQNSSGQLGLGDTTNKSSPNQVGSLSTWYFVTASQAHNLFLKT